jgi:hypothetical protein
MLFKRKIFLLEKVQEQNEGGNQPISKEKKRKEKKRKPLPDFSR